MKKKSIITLKSDVRKLFITCYMENFSDGWELVKENIRRFPKDVAHIQAIKHDKDFLENDFFNPGEEKEHFHILIWLVNGNHRRVETILNALAISFRPEDKSRLENGNALTVPNDYASMSLYLTHESKNCEKKWKTYNIDEIISNLSIDEIKTVRDGAIRLNVSGKLTDEEMVKIDDVCYKWGYDLKDFADLYDSFPYKIRKNTGMRVCKESYYRGIERRISDNQENHVLINRMNVFLSGGSNKGKTWACEEYFKRDKYLEIDGGGTGKFDKLKCSHNTLIINDDTCPNLLNMSDNKICQAYKRMKDNPYWCGENLIISSNLTFEEFIKDFREDHKKALRNRFFVIYVAEDKKCYVLNASKKCVNDVEMKKRFMDFLNAIQKSIMEYEPENKEDFWKDVLKYNIPNDSDFS